MELYWNYRILERKLATPGLGGFTDSSDVEDPGLHFTSTVTSSTRGPRPPGWSSCPTSPTWRRSPSPYPLSPKRPHYSTISDYVAIRAVFLRSLRIERNNRRLILRIFQKSSNWPSFRPSGGKTDALSPFLIVPRPSFEVNYLLETPSYGEWISIDCKLSKETSTRGDVIIRSDYVTRLRRGTCLP